jgi:hypothetical protein
VPLLQEELPRRRPGYQALSGFPTKVFLWQKAAQFKKKINFPPKNFTFSASSLILAHKHEGKRPQAYSTVAMLQTGTLQAKTRRLTRNQSIHEATKCIFLFEYSCVRIANRSTKL